jgi:conserved oligomeric Golgi complex subunit 6
MFGSYFNGISGSLENDPSSPKSLSQGAFSGRHNAISNKLTSVLSRSYIDPEIRDTLSILDTRGTINDSNTRRRLWLDAQKEVIDCNGAIVQDFGQVAEVLNLAYKNFCEC